jgi:hypothetical protein
VTYRLRRDRDWLTTSEAVELRQLFADNWAVKEVLPWKVIHALNLGEDAVHLRILQRALLLITVALDGLVHSHRRNAKKQFCERIPQLADEVGVEGIDEEFASELWDRRSEAAHGAQVSMFPVKPGRAEDAEAEHPEQPHAEPELPEAELDTATRLGLAQDLLRAATRKALQDAEFQRIFESNETVAEKWPVEV